MLASISVAYPDSLAKRHGIERQITKNLDSYLDNTQLNEVVFLFE